MVCTFKKKMNNNLLSLQIFCLHRYPPFKSASFINLILLSSSSHLCFLFLFVFPTYCGHSYQPLPFIPFSPSVYLHCSSLAFPVCCVRLPPSLSLSLSLSPSLILFLSHVISFHLTAFVTPISRSLEMWRRITMTQHAFLFQATDRYDILSAVYYCDIYGFNSCSLRINFDTTRKTLKI